MAKWIMGGLLALVVLAGGAALVNAHGGGGHEVRIEARRLDDGRIEFALRERGGERILPPARYFPAETEAGRWLNASWITVGAGDEFMPTPAATPTPSAAIWPPPGDPYRAIPGAPGWQVYTQPDRSGGLERSAQLRSTATLWDDGSSRVLLGVHCEIRGWDRDRLFTREPPTGRKRVIVDWGRSVVPSCRSQGGC